MRTTDERAPARPAATKTVRLADGSRNLLFGVVTLAILMSTIDGTIVAVGLPAMRAGLHTSYLLIGWTILAYQLGQLVVLPIAGALSDDLGRKRVFLISIIVFTVSSFLCGLAPNVYVLIVCRLLQALGGGAFLPSCTGIVADLFHDRRAQAVGLLSTIFPIGAVLGPNLGGLVIDHLSWRYIFYVNVPIGIAVFLLTWTLYHPPKEEAVHRGLDAAGVALFALATALLLVALSWLGDHPRAIAQAPLLWLAIAAAAGLFVLFGLRERRTADPMLDVSLLRNRQFLAVVTYSFFWGAGAIGFTSFLPTFAQLHYHLSATVSGAILTPRSVLQIGISTAAALFLVRLGYRLPMLLGNAFMAISLFFTALAPEHPALFGVQIPSAIYLALVIAVLGVAFGISGPASNNVALEIVPGRVAAVTGIRSMFLFLGGTVGTAVAVFVIALFSDPSRGIQVLYAGLTVVTICTAPLVFLLPGVRSAPRITRVPRGFDH